MTLSIDIKTLAHFEGLELPQYATAQSAAVDLPAAISEPITIQPGKREKIPTGLCIALPAGYEAQIRSRSGLAYRNGIRVFQGVGTIDADYRGEMSILLQNDGDESFTIKRGMRIAQMVIAKHEVAQWVVKQELEDTERGAGGFGSTGTK